MGWRSRHFLVFSAQLVQSLCLIPKKKKKPLVQGPQTLSSRHQALDIPEALPVLDA